MRHAIQRNATTDHILVAAEPFPPEILRHHRDVRAFLFVRQKIAAANWTNTQHIEIIRRHAATVKLDRIAHAGQRETCSVLCRKAGENRLAVAIMHKARHRNRDFFQIGIVSIREHVHDPLRLLKRQPAQKQIVDQAEDCSVQPDPQRQRNQRQESEPGRL